MRISSIFGREIAHLTVRFTRYLFTRPGERGFKPRLAKFRFQSSRPALIVAIMMRGILRFALLVPLYRAYFHKAPSARRVFVANKAAPLPSSHFRHVIKHRSRGRRSPDICRGKFTPRCIPFTWIGTGGKERNAGNEKIRSALSPRKIPRARDSTC